MSIPTYEDFDLLIRQSDGAYTAVARSSAGGTIEQRFAAPFTGEKLEIFLLKMGRPRAHTRHARDPQETLAIEFGTVLYTSIFCGELGVTFHHRLAEALSRKNGLRIRLNLENAGALGDLPWEYLYRPDSREFIALSKDTPITRSYQNVAASKSLLVLEPLRILVMISDPVSREYPQLDVHGEWTKLRDALEPLAKKGLIELVRLEHATLCELQKELRQRSYHIFHFIGHGSYRVEAESGVLVLETDRKEPDLVDGDRIGAILRDKETLRLVLLNSCEGARASVRDPFSGIAQSLLLKGIPAIIAMQFEISDDVAIELSSMFYSALADGYPVDAALAEARKSIYGRFKEVEWGAPVLYLRSPDGLIFDVRKRTSIHDWPTRRWRMLPVLGPEIRLSPAALRMLCRVGTCAAALFIGYFLVAHFDPIFESRLRAYRLEHLQSALREAQEMIRTAEQTKEPQRSTQLAQAWEKYKKAKLLEEKADETGEFYPQLVSVEKDLTRLSGNHVSSN